MIFCVLHLQREPVTEYRGGVLFLFEAAPTEAGCKSKGDSLAKAAAALSKQKESLNWRGGGVTIYAKALF
jgi:hypothetical protein